jgi:hypothetical protein
MTRCGAFIVAGFGIALSIAAVPVAEAQGGSGRQTRQTAPSRRRPSREVLSGSFSMATTADDNGRATAADARPEEFRGRQISGVGQASVSFTPLESSGMRLKFDAATGMQYVASLNTVLMTGKAGSASFGFPIGKLLNASVAHSASETPNYSLVTTFMPPDTVAPLESLVAPDIALQRNPSVSTSTGLGVGRSLGRKASIAFSGDVRRTRFKNGTLPRLTAFSGRLQGTYQLWKTVGIRLGYGRQAGVYRTESTVSPMQAADSIDAGLTFNRSLAITRRTTIAFSSGSSIVDNGGSRQIGLIGSGNVSYAGLATLSYNRDVRMVGGFSAPVFTDTLTANAGTRSWRGLQLSTSASYSLGKVGAGDQQSSFSTWAASAQMSANLLRAVGLSVGYSIYEQRNVAALINPADTTRTQRRQSVRAGLSVRMPFWRTALRPERGN